MGLENFKKLWRKTWHFIWEDDSLLSWIVNIILAFVIIKFLFYPALGAVFGTPYPVVAVISESMEHNSNFDTWWENRGQWYVDHDISKNDFRSFRFKNGFNMGDIIALSGVDPGEVEVGDVIVFQSTIRAEPIIHRVVAIQKVDGQFMYTTKGDNVAVSQDFEQTIPAETVLGRAVFRIPWLGYIKLIFTGLLNMLMRG